jgi:hypothetical protein
LLNKTKRSRLLKLIRQVIILKSHDLHSKIDVAVNAPEAGTITQWFVSEEDNVEVGQKLCEIDTEGKASSGT